jgi:Uma2 family endonuclease
MAEAIEVPTGAMTREEFYAWAEAQPRGRFELVEGQVVAMAPERAAHARSKASIWLALREAIRAEGLACEAFIDGLAVEVGNRTAYEPDALVNCGDRVGEDELVASSPVIVVEVISPSSVRMDAVQKLADYFRVPSIQHYLIVDLARRMAIHHRRLDDGSLGTRIAAAGALRLDPPGLTVQVERFFED